MKYLHGPIENQTLDSREVAEMMETPHNDLLKKIRSYINYLVDGGEGNFSQSEFFIESAYFNDQNKEQPNYQITRKGCELLGHKMTGKKGIQFSARYIQKFHAMEKHIASGISLSEMKSSLETLADDIFQRKADEISTAMKEYYRPSHQHKLGISQYIKNRLGVGATQDEYELVKQRVLLKLNAGKWEDVPVEVLKDSLNIIDESIRVIKMDRQVNQISLFE